MTRREMLGRRIDGAMHEEPKGVEKETERQKAVNIHTRITKIRKKIKKNRTLVTRGRVVEATDAI